MRLRLPCIGAGQKRYVFVDQRGPNDTQSESFAGQCRKLYDEKYALAITRIPPTAHVDLVNSFVDIIKPSTNARFNLSWVFGPYLNLVPQRLGRDKALDSSVKALTKAHNTFCTDQTPTKEGLTAYSEALAAIRDTMHDPNKASTSETMCAILLVMICQSLYGAPNPESNAHLVGMETVLKVRGGRRLRDDFERELLTSVQGATVVGGFFNPHVQVTSKDWRNILNMGRAEQGEANRLLLCLSQIRDLMYGQDQSAAEDSHFALSGEIMVHYRRLKSRRPKMRDELEKISAPFSDIPLTSSPEHVTRRVLGQAYGMLLMFLIFLNTALRAFDPNNIELVADSDLLVQETLSNAEKFQHFRPLGDFYIEIILSTAWIGTSDPSLRARVEHLLLHADVRWSVKTNMNSLREVSERIRTLAQRPSLIRESANWMIS
ncbi:MAG: hypothetical protein M1820_010311 [Bogoriella megaspora]|nr:MAG: hypothetical protein M1820_010311 [Bogoriella megaspora]